MLLDGDDSHVSYLLESGLDEAPLVVESYSPTGTNGRTGGR
jgi:hypothetical protein